MEKRGVSEGMTVHSSDGEKLGKVVQCADDFFLVEKGFFFPKDYVARYEYVERVDGDDIHLNLAASALRESGAEAETSTSRMSEATSGLGATSASSTREDTTIPLHEEELTAEKRERQAGEVKVRKDVVTEHKTITVPVTREEVHVERVPASGRAEVSGDAFKEGKSISVPVREEEVEITKRPVVREEVRVSKTRRQEERRADAEVRREEARIEGTGNIDKTGERTDISEDVNRKDPDDV
jgi:uncharacterized protein (TIGR02271 family)